MYTDCKLKRNKFYIFSEAKEEIIKKYNESKCESIILKIKFLFFIINNVNYELQVVYYISLASSNAYSVFNFNKLGEFEGNNNRNILFIYKLLKLYVTNCMYITYN